MKHPGYLAVVFLLQFQVLSHAQATFSGCRDINGVPVQSIQSTAINDIAMATILQGYPVILFNPLVVSQAPPSVRLFFYAHECGHHALGHVVGGQINIEQEQEADCFGIRELVRTGRINNSDIATIQNQLYHFGRADWTHLPGPQRAINLRACLANTVDRNTDSTNNDAIDECISDKIESCVEDCTSTYNYPEAACRARFCNPQLGSNRGWAASCRRRLR